MRAAAVITRDLVLVGGGHTHALVLRMLAMRPIAGLRITLVSPASHTPYSGMLPGLVAGHYSFEQTHIDLARLCQWAGVRFIAGTVTALDPAARRLSLAGRPDIDYDLVSIDIGSQPELDSVPGAREFSVPVKPVAGLWQRWQDLLRRLAALPAGKRQRIAVVGGGAGSVELALAMAHRLAREPVDLALWCGAPEILLGYNSRARKATVAALARHGVAVAVAARVERVEAGRLLLADGREAPYDELFWCTGAAAAPWVAASGLPVDERGFLAVTDSLQSVADARVFGAGDIATQLNHPRPKAGVYAVRQGPVLANNLRAALLGKPLRQHRPQQRFLSLVSLGDRLAAADRGPFSASGRWVWRWKDSIDRKFMAQFEELPTSMPRGDWGRLPQAAAAAAQPPCGGCGAKVGADPLAQTLAELARQFPRHCPPPGSADDTAPIPGDAAAVVQSLDMLRELVADPWLMGRIAANHALSDLYASGARPVSALAAVSLPYAGPEVLQRELHQLLAGALHEMARVDCLLAGGHSMQGPELSIGFVVNGVAMAADGRWLRKRGLNPGDKLILTKPLGTGVLFAAHMQLLADGRDIAAAVESMLVSNGPAAELALTHSAGAGTDITGFGLLGHLLEMLGEELEATLQLDGLPLLPGALAQLRGGVRSSMHPANAQAFAALATQETTDEALLQILFDPQTSGGLLLGVGAEGAGSLRDALRCRAYPQAEIIGEVAARKPGAPAVRIN
ncbi:MAG: selenide, water dikinase SelD [Halieaceae bacterium]|nr:selenide, water dikinase SelD [Halieaceae bacterium]